MPPTTKNTDGYTAKLFIIPSQPGSKVHEHTLDPGDITERLDPRICAVENRRDGLYDTLHYYDSQNTPTLTAKDPDGKSIVPTPNMKYRTHEALWLHNMPIKVDTQETVHCQGKDGKLQSFHEPDNSEHSLWIMPATSVISHVEGRTRPSWYSAPADTTLVKMFDHNGDVIQTEDLRPGTGCLFTGKTLIRTEVPDPTDLAISSHAISNQSGLSDSRDV